MGFHCWVIYWDIWLKFIELSMGTPCWCPSEGHKHGSQKLTKTFGIDFCGFKQLLFCHELYYTFTLISLLILWLSKLLKITKRVLSCIRESFETDAMLVSRRMKSQKFKMLYFQNERGYQAKNLGEGIFWSHLQPGGDIKPENQNIKCSIIFHCGTQSNTNWLVFGSFCLSRHPRLESVTRFPDRLHHMRKSV